MRLLVQVVKEATVTVENTTVGKIGRGLLILFGAHANDNSTIRLTFGLDPTQVDVMTECFKMIHTINVP